jgi:hypothetical protein
MNADLVAGVGDHLHLLGECLDRVAGDEPRRGHVVPVEEPEQPWTADLAREQASRDVVGRVVAGVGP